MGGKDGRKKENCVKMMAVERNKRSELVKELAR